MGYNLNSLLDENDKQVGFAFESRNVDIFTVVIFQDEQKALNARETHSLYSPGCACGRPPVNLKARYEGADNRLLRACLHCSAIVADPDAPGLK